MEKLIITAAICGAEVTKEQNPAVPYTVEEIVREATVSYTHLDVYKRQGQARIRIQLSAAHTREQLDRALAAFIKIGKKLGVIK